MISRLFVLSLSNNIGIGSLVVAFGIGAALALTTTGLLQIAEGQPQAAPLDEAVALAPQQELRRLLADALTAQSQRDGALGAVDAARAAWTEARALYTALKMPQARLAPAWLGGEKAP